MNVLKLNEIYHQELKLFFVAPDSSKKWQQLERLHILGQQFLFKHLEVHLLMLRQALTERKLKEILGQLFRLSLVIPGHIFRRLPMGNVGSSRVSAFKKMEIPNDLKAYFEQTGGGT